MAAHLVAAIDHGTTSTRCILFTRDGKPVATGQREQAMFYPQPGWVELDMEQVWQRTQECIHDALAAAGAGAADHKRPAMPGTGSVEQPIKRRALVSPTTQRQLPGSRTSTSHEVFSWHCICSAVCWSENDEIASRRIAQPSEKW
jgi:hypothetical protein